MACRRDPRADDRRLASTEVGSSLRERREVAGEPRTVSQGHRGTNDEYPLRCFDWIDRLGGASRRLVLANRVQRAARRQVKKLFSVSRPVAGSATRLSGGAMSPVGKKPASYRIIRFQAAGTRATQSKYALPPFM